MTVCEIFTEIKNMLTAIQTHEFADVEELKNKLQNVQDVVNQAVTNFC